MQQIADWLNTLGLGQYAKRFAENYIDAGVLRDLTDQDLEKIGIPLGHRKILLRAIRELAAASPAAPPPATVSKPALHDSAERRQLPGRRRARLFRLSAGARGRCRAGSARGAGAGRSRSEARWRPTVIVAR